MIVFQKYPQPAILAVILIVLLAVMNLFRANQPPKSVREDLAAFYTGLIDQAEQLSSLLESGTTVVIVDLDREALGFDKKEYQRVIQAIEDSGLTVEHIEKLVRDESEGWDEFLSGFPYFEFVRVVERYPDVGAIVSLCGPPYFTSRTGDVDPASLPKLLAVCGYNGEATVEDLLDGGWLYAGTEHKLAEKDGKTVEVYELLHNQK